MGLDAEEMVAHGQGGYRTVGRRGDAASAARQVQHLVVVAVEDPDRVVPRGHPALALVHVDLPVADAQCGYALDPASECLGDDLMAEADAHRRGPGGVEVPDQVQQVVDPRLVLVGTVCRSGDEPAVLFVRRRRERALHDRVVDELHVGLDRREEVGEELLVTLVARA